MLRGSGIRAPMLRINGAEADNSIIGRGGFLKAPTGGEFGVYRAPIRLV